MVLPALRPPRRGQQLAAPADDALLAWRARRADL